MFPNCSGEVRRPCARTEYVNFWFLGAGLPPICPAGFTVFCDWIAFTISVTAIPNCARWSGLTQSLIAYWAAPKTCA